MEDKIIEVKQSIRSLDELKTVTKLLFGESANVVFDKGCQITINTGCLVDSFGDVTNPDGTYLDGGQ